MAILYFLTAAACLAAALLYTAWNFTYTARARFHLLRNSVPRLGVPLWISMSLNRVPSGQTFPFSCCSIFRFAFFFAVFASISSLFVGQALLRYLFTVALPTARDFLIAAFRRLRCLLSTALS